MIEIICVLHLHFTCAVLSLLCCFSPIIEILCFLRIRFVNGKKNIEIDILPVQSLSLLCCFLHLRNERSGRRGVFNENKWIFSDVKLSGQPQKDLFESLTKLFWPVSHDSTLC